MQLNATLHPATHRIEGPCINSQLHNKHTLTLRQTQSYMLRAAE